MLHVITAVSAVSLINKMTEQSMFLNTEQKAFTMLIPYIPLTVLFSQDVNQPHHQNSFIYAPNPICLCDYSGFVKRPELSIFI